MAYENNAINIYIYIYIFITKMQGIRSKNRIGKINNMQENTLILNR